MPRGKHSNKTNPCAKVLGQIAQTCFLIGEETDFDAHMDWAAHVNEITVQVTPSGAGRQHAVLEFDEYLNIPSTDGWSSEFRTDTYPKVKKFAAELDAFYRAHSS